MTNRCGFDSLGPQLDPPRPGNGQPFGPCSATSGYLDEGTVADGTCYPQTFADATVGGVCVRTGAVPKTRACRVDAEFDEPMYLCAPDSICFAYGADAPRRPCSRDVECVGIPRTIDNRTELVDGYCAKDGACQAWGFCGDVCNSGYDGAAAHENAGCTDPDAVCIYPGGIPSLMREYPVLEGFCESHCTMFDPQTCPEFPSGVARACSPSFEADDPLGGTCIDQLASDKMIGDVCEHATDATECPTGSACLTLSTGEPPRCLQWCECEAGFDGSTHVCRDEAANAGCGTAGDACVVAVPFSPVGLCATRG